MGNKLIDTVKRVFVILEAFTSTQPRMRLQEVVNKTALPKVTVLRFLRTLTSLNYLCFDAETKLYSLSPRVMSLGFTALSGVDVREAARPFLERLSETTGQNVNLGILDGIDVVFVERIKRKQMLNIDLEVGSRFNAYRSSIGQVILGYMDRTDCERVVKELLRDPEIASLAGPKGKLLYSNLENIRKNGYALNDELFAHGLRAIGAPVFNHRGAVDAGINITFFSYQVTREELIERYSAPLISTASQISAARGYVAAGTTMQTS